MTGPLLSLSSSVLPPAPLAFTPRQPIRRLARLGLLLIGPGPGAATLATPGGGLLSAPFAAFLTLPARFSDRLVGRFEASGSTAD